MGYSGNAVQLCGQTTINVQYNGREFTHTFLVVKSSSVNLLGRDLCHKLQMSITVPDCNKNCKDKNVAYNVKQSVLNEFKGYLSDNFLSAIKETVCLNVLPGAHPIFAKARTVPVRIKDSVKAELNRLVDNGTITKVFSSNWASPTVNVLKNNGSVRICGDFSATVNKFLDPVQSPLPSVDEVIARVGCATIFSKLDLANAFLQIPLDENSKQYTTINTCEGLFRYNFLPFGLTASPGIFQSFMSKILDNIEDVVVYHDDILVMSPTIEAHNNTLRKVLSTLKKAGIKLNSSKCSFYVDKVQYLGHIFSKDGVHPNPEKVRAILEAPAPNDLKQLQAFLGLCNYYSQFIPNFSAVLAPLYSLLKKDAKFHWGPAQRECFTIIKKFIQNKSSP